MHHYSLLCFRLCAPLCFILATIMGGLCLFVTSMIYLVVSFYQHTVDSLFKQENNIHAKSQEAHFADFKI